MGVKFLFLFLLTKANSLCLTVPSSNVNLDLSSCYDANVGDVCNYNCPFLYEKFNSPVCQENGEWSSQADCEPVCNLDIIYCIDTSESISEEYYNLAQTFAINSFTYLSSIISITRGSVITFGENFSRQFGYNDAKNEIEFASKIEQIQKANFAETTYIGGCMDFAHKLKENKWNLMFVITDGNFDPKDFVDIKTASNDILNDNYLIYAAGYGENTETLIDIASDPSKILNLKENNFLPDPDFISEECIYNTQTVYCNSPPNILSGTIADVSMCVIMKVDSVCEFKCLEENYTPRDFPVCTSYGNWDIKAECGHEDSLNWLFWILISLGLAIIIASAIVIKILLRKKSQDIPEKMEENLYLGEDNSVALNDPEVIVFD